MRKIKRSNPRPRGVQHGPGHVYVLRSTRDLLLKVGGTKRLGMRLCELRLIFGHDACYVALWPTNEVAAMERLAHTVCKRWRIHDERYRMTVDWLGEYYVVRSIETAFALRNRFLIT